MSDSSQTALEDCKETLTTEVTDDSCITECIETVPLDRTSRDYHTPECIDPVVEVKREDLQDVKQETADESDTEDGNCFVKLEPADYDYTDVLQCLFKVDLRCADTFMLEKHTAYNNTLRCMKYTARLWHSSRWKTGDRFS